MVLKLGSQACFSSIILTNVSLQIIIARSVKYLMLKYTIRLYDLLALVFSNAYIFIKYTKEMD